MNWIFYPYRPIRNTSAVILVQRQVLPSATNNEKSKFIVQILATSAMKIQKVESFYLMGLLEHAKKWTMASGATSGGRSFAQLLAQKKKKEVKILFNFIDQ
mmetsp:Transcript_12938/g.19397  ORF Transcript_12938/g.19397 Transcript_12938/m.19397 type:complete len:101 (+) Transcript_12938:1197-1499(+)